MMGDNAHQAELRDKAIETWNEIYDGPDASGAYLGLVEEHLTSGAVVIDVGCGTGHIIAEIHRRVGARPRLLLGLDPSAAMLAIARRKVPLSEGVDFREAAAARIPLDAGCVNLVLSRLSEYDAQEIARVLMPGGTFLEYGLGPLDSEEIAVAFGNRYTCDYAPDDPEGWLRHREASLAMAGLPTVRFEQINGIDYLTRQQLVETIEMVPLVVPFSATEDSTILDSMAREIRPEWEEPRYVVHRQITLRVARKGR